MNRYVLSALIGVVALATASGCRVRVRGRVPTAQVTVRTPAPPPPPSGNGTVSVSVGGGITTVDNYCQQGAPEVCNGLDDNCNGVIDEGCGYNTGNIQITLAWATGADLDMYVTDPSGFTISYQNTQSPTGGVLDHDARGACVRQQSDATVENVYWDSAQPPSGRYLVEVHYWGDCNVAGTTPATLSIAVGGQIIGAYQVQLNPRDRQQVAYFDMP
ncbi:MAG: MopE-related protein [Sandaracinaceae bacterium]